MNRIQIPWERWEESGRVGARAELHDIRLCKLATTLNDLGAGPPYVAELEAESSFQQEEDARHVVVSAEYTLKALAFGADQDRDDEDVEPDLSVAEVSFTLLALYALRDREDHEAEATNDELEAFAESAGLMALHPYARELIQDQTARLGLPSLTLGVAQIARLDQ
ncbi:hypothetical protein BH23ACT6_BH23ACT6_12000 [soil metagenome]